MFVVRVVWASLFVLLANTAGAQVDEERLRLMHETISYTDVIDARDGPDPLDVNVHIEYTRLRDTSTVYREQTSDDGVRGTHALAHSKRETSQLAIGVEVGLYRDLMTFVRMPLVLSESRTLSLARGVTAEQAARVLGEGSAGQSALFTLPFAAPTRAGVDYIAVGGAWAILNQARRSWQPTWVLRFEGRRAVGKVLQPCQQGTMTKTCGTLSSEDRDGDTYLDGTRSTNPHPGLSRGISALLFETRFSRRLGRAEPYAGFSFLVEWPALRTVAREAFQPDGYGRARPGSQSAGTLGLALIPWENRGSYQRLVLDGRLAATYVGRGTDYSPLFDALGSTSDPTLSASRAGVNFRGLTELEAYLRYGGQVSLEIQAARYVRFGIGSWLQWATDHAITGRDPCRGPKRDNAAEAADGRVCSGGKPDARERGVIDALGRRFILRDQLMLGVYAQATATF
jgi:hypothetical protein